MNRFCRAVLSFAIRWSGDVDIGIGCGTDRVGCKNAIAGACQVGSDLSRIFGSINLPHLGRMVLLDALRDAKSKLACPRAFAAHNAKRSGHLAVRL